MLARAQALADRQAGDAEVEEVLVAGGHDRAVLNQARARCLAWLHDQRGNGRGALTLDLLDHALETLESRPAG